MSNGEDRGPLVARPQGYVLYASSASWIRGSNNNDSDGPQGSEDGDAIIRAVQLQRNVRSQSLVKNLPHKRYGRQCWQPQVVDMNGRGERIRTSDLSVPNLGYGKNVSFCLFKSCSHQGFTKVFAFRPIRYSSLSV